MNKAEKPQARTPKPTAPYDFLSFPLGVIDWKHPGVTFNAEANGALDIDAIAQYNTLLANGYRIANMTVDSGRLYLMFAKA